MDIFMPIAICVIFIIIFTICGWCCKRKREGTIYGYAAGPTVTVTTTHPQPMHQPSGVVPPYPVDPPRHPIPHSAGPHGPGFTTHNPPYPTHSMNMPYPQPGHAAPYPPTSGAAPYPPAPYQQTGGTPYPPASGDYNAHPPPYDVAVASPPVQPLPVKEGYGKQAPYNPNYN